MQRFSYRCTSTAQLYAMYEGEEDDDAANGTFGALRLLNSQGEEKKREPSERPGTRRVQCNSLKEFSMAGISLGALKTKAQADVAASNDRLQLTINGLGTGDTITSADLLGASMEVGMNGVIVNFYSAFCKDQADIIKGVVRNMS